MYCNRSIFKKRNYYKVYISAIFALIVSAGFILFSDIGFNESSNIFVNSMFTNVVKLFVIGIAIAILYVSHGYIKNNQLNLFEYPILLLFAVLGMLIMLSSNDLLLLYVSIELQSLSLYVLVALNRIS